MIGRSSAIDWLPKRPCSNAMDCLTANVCVRDGPQAAAYSYYSNSRGPRSQQLCADYSYDECRSSSRQRRAKCPLHSVFSALTAPTALREIDRERYREHIRTGHRLRLCVEHKGINVACSCNVPCLPVRHRSLLDNLLSIRGIRGSRNLALCNTLSHQFQTVFVLVFRDFKDLSRITVEART